MSCQEFESVSTELARGSLLDAASRESAHAHAATCAPCAARLRRERALSSALREVGASMREMEAHARVEAALLARLRERRSVASTFEDIARVGAQAHARRDVNLSLFAPRLRRALFATAVAASLLLVSVLAWRAFTRKETTTTSVVPTVQGNHVEGDSSSQAIEQISSQDDPTTHDAATKDRVTQVHATDEVATTTKQRTPFDSVVRSSSRRRAEAPVAALPISFREDGGRVTPDDAGAISSTMNAGASELASSADFVPLVAPDNSAPLDGGQMVRVEVPRAALAALGLPVNASRTGASVKADVLLAHDGTARAIRLLP
ncbi:MAG: hypothetical protein QOE33_2632 [Acidobacteriota bacterium]|nr:hypothetical protein [Acidobacteriota bacterium]